MLVPGVRFLTAMDYLFSSSGLMGNSIIRKINYEETGIILCSVNKFSVLVLLDSGQIGWMSKNKLFLDLRFNSY